MTSRKEMLSWTKKHLNTWTDMDGYYGAQCVDLTMAYMKHFANFSMYGNAIDYMRNPIPPGWRRFKKGEVAIEPGDIAIWQWGPLDIYGHVGIVLEVKGRDIISAEQNVDGTPEKGGVAKKMTRDDTQLVGFIRPQYDSSEAWTRIPKKGKFTVTVEALNVRDVPSVYGKKKAVYYLGESLYYDSYVIREGHIWVSYISYSGERHYVAAGTHNGEKRTSRWGTGIEVD